MSSSVTAYINLSALRHNFNVVKQYASESRILAMIKSRAYGHGLLEVAKALPEADALGVARLEEGLLLRKNGITQPIVVMSGFMDQRELPVFEKNNLTSVVHSEAQLSALNQYRAAFPKWLKIDTGMNRLGVAVDSAKMAYSIVNPAVVLTHLAKADEGKADFTENQLLRFEQAIENMKAEFSIANSAAILAYPKTHSDWVRPGLMLYGVSPFSTKTNKDFNLQPVMTLKAKILSVKAVKKGDSIGYGGTYTCPRDMKIAVVAIGYGDGYPRHAKNGTPVLVKGQRCELVGRVSMDLITVDVSAVLKVEAGDEVTLWGEGLPVEEVAQQADTIPYQLLCDVSARVAFVYQN